MPENFYFGGGATVSTMHPAVLAATLLATVLVLLLPRKYVFIPVVGIAVLTPFGAQLFFGGFHFFAIRILAFVGACRMLREKLLWKTPLFAGGVTSFDNIFVAWALCRGAACILLVRDTGAVVNQVAFWIDTLGVYILFRYSIQNTADIVRAIKVTAVLVAVSAVCMLYEATTHSNVFNTIRTYPVIPVMRESRIRAQGSFGVSITAGTFAATAIPLFFWLWKEKKTLALIGIAGGIVGTVCSVSSTPFSAALGAFLSLALWPIRAHMREVRWGIVVTLVAIAIVMEAPIWYLLAKVDFVGGHAWGRGLLVDQFAQHISDWWLIGTDQNANWGEGLWDRCNGYVAEAASGGLLTLGLFIALISRGFGIAGRARRRSSGDQAWLPWCVGATLFVHVIAFQGVGYWDQMKIPWMLFLAIFPVLDRLKRTGKVGLQPGESSAGAPEAGDSNAEPSLEVIRA